MRRDFSGIFDEIREKNSNFAFRLRNRRRLPASGPFRRTRNPYDMSQRQNLNTDLRTTMRLTQQQLRFVKLLELSAPELEEAVEMEIAENPALEAAGGIAEEEQSAMATDDGAAFSESAEEMQKADYRDPDEIPHYRLEARNFSPDDNFYEATQADDSESIYDYLRRQLAVRTLDPEVAAAATYVIGSLDPNGYLRRSKAQLADDMAISAGAEPDSDTLDKAIEAVKSLEPAGIGASDLRECLLLQVKALPPSQERADAETILNRYFSEFTMKHSHRIISQMKASPERVKNAIDLILNLNPKPGASLGTGGNETAAGIIPDFIINVDREDISISIPGTPDLQIEETFSNAVGRMERNARSRQERQDRKFIMSRFNAARDFIQLVRQRRETLFSVMAAIVKIQKDYFLTQDVHSLRPMMIKDIAALTGYDISVISRATNNKYAATPWGIFPLRFFFSDSLGEEGGEFTNREVEAEIRELVEAEDKRHPLSDEKLRAALVGKGYDVSRRTVAKYRDRMKIPVARLRKNI